MRYELFTKAGCPECPAVRELCEQSGMKGYSVDCDTPQGMALAKAHGVMKTPTAILLDDDSFEEVARCHTAAELKKFLL